MAKTTVFTTTGLWSVAGNWNNGVPADGGDTVTVNVGTLCTFDADMSGWTTGLAALTINGGLVANASGSNYLNMGSAANISFGTAGYIAAGTSLAVPYPQVATFKIYLKGGRINLSTGKSLRLYCTEPTYKYIKLSQAELAGATVLHVDTNVTGDIWAAGNLIRVDDIAGTLPDSEERTIAAGGIAAGTITITAGLTNDKTAGSYVILETRNVAILGDGTNTYGLYGGGFADVYASIRNFVNATYLCHALHISVFASCNGALVYSLNSDARVVTGSVYTNYFSANCFSYFSSGCSSAYYRASGFMPAVICFGNAYDVRISPIELLGAFLNSPIQAYTYGYQYFRERDQTVVRDIGGVAGAIKAWMPGGRVVTDTVIYPVGYTYSYNFIFETAGYATFLDFPFNACVGVNTFSVWMKKDTNAMGVTPRIQIIDPKSDTFDGGVALFESVMADNTDWQEIQVYYTSIVERKLWLRVTGTHSAGNLWMAYKQSPAVAGLAGV